MNRIALSLVLFLGVVILPALAKTIRTEQVALPTLQCGMCKRTIETKLNALKGLDSITVDVDTKTATVVYDADRISLQSIEKAIAKAGYDANETKANRKAQRKLHDCCQPGSH